VIDWPVVAAVGPEKAAVGLTLVTVTTAESVAVWPNPSVTVRVAVYVPLSAYVFVGLRVVAVVPSPNVHR
jgi:hypothetical protein